jgi:hypothetical protein
MDLHRKLLTTKNVTLKPMQIWSEFRESISVRYRNGNNWLQKTSGWKVAGRCTHSIEWKIW